jgi:hypothetical protein
MCQVTYNKYLDIYMFLITLYKIVEFVVCEAQLSLF